MVMLKIEGKSTKKRRDRKKVLKGFRVSVGTWKRVTAKKKKGMGTKKKERKIKGGKRKKTGKKERRD